MTTRQLLKRHLCDCVTCRARRRREEATLFLYLYTIEEMHAIAERTIQDFGADRVKAFVNGGDPDAESD